MDMGMGNSTGYGMGMGMGMGAANSSASAGSMDMGMGGCKISMLWNWYTIDTCFLSSSWHNNTLAKFAGSVIGVFFLTIAIEGVRRCGREYDRRLILAAKAANGLTGVSTPTSGSKDLLPQLNNQVDVLPTWPQQVIRGVSYGTQFSAAFLVMLLGMYYNGYILFAIFLGQTTGYVIFGRDTCKAEVDQCTVGHCC